MTRRRKTILDDLALLPWWVSVILAAVSYLSLKYWIPSIEFQRPIGKAIAMAFPTLAPIVGALFLVGAVLSAFNTLRKRRLFDRQDGVQTLRAASWREFEELVGEAYRRQGYRVTETGGRGTDGGVDLVLKRGGETLLVQCKHWKMDKVGVKVIRELYGVVAAEGATGGIVISSGSFTQEARDFVSGKAIELLDGAELLRLVGEVQGAPRPGVKTLEENPCPLCGAAMVLRTVKKGPNAGEQFWGCSSYPKCRATKPYGGSSPEDASHSDRGEVMRDHVVEVEYLSGVWRVTSYNRTAWCPSDADLVKSLRAIVARNGGHSFRAVCRCPEEMRSRLTASLSAAGCSPAD